MLSFICVGPQRTASSWLDKMLRQHHQVALPELVKETFFWDQRYSLGHNWYYNHFPSKDDPKILGEVAPTCFDDSEALNRIMADNPNIKILICLRDPIERTYSLFCHNYATGRIKDTFSNALKKNRRLLESSKYTKYVNAWEQKAGAENILIIQQEGVKQDPIGVLNDICHFIGINPIQWQEAEEKYGERAKPRSLVLVRILSRFSRGFRHLGLHSIPELAKNIGLKQSLYQGGSIQYPPLLNSDQLLLQEEFAQEYEWFNQLPKSRTFCLSDI